MEAARFAALARTHAGQDSPLVFEPGLSPDGLRRLCDALLQVCPGRCACFSGEDGRGYRYAIGCRDGDLRAFVRELNEALSGRGGGKPDFVQGSVQADRSAVEAFLSQPG